MGPKLRNELVEMLATLRAHSLGQVWQVLPGAVPDTHCYLRVKNGHSYTSLHSDYGFFMKEYKADPNCSAFSNVHCSSGKF